MAADKPAGESPAPLSLMPYAGAFGSRKPRRVSSKHGREAFTTAIAGETADVAAAALVPLFALEARIAEALPSWEFAGELSAAEIGPQAH